MGQVAGGPAISAQTEGRRAASVAAKEKLQPGRQLLRESSEGASSGSQERSEARPGGEGAGAGRPATAAAARSRRGGVRPWGVSSGAISVALRRAGPVGRSACSGGRCPVGEVLAGAEPRAWPLPRGWGVSLKGEGLRAAEEVLGEALPLAEARPLLDTVSLADSALRSLSMVWKVLTTSSTQTRTRFFTRASGRRQIGGLAGSGSSGSVGLDSAGSEAASAAGASAPAGSTAGVSAWAGTTAWRSAMGATATGSASVTAAVTSPDGGQAGCGAEATESAPKLKNPATADPAGIKGGTAAAGGAVTGSAENSGADRGPWPKPSRA